MVLNMGSAAIWGCLLTGGVCNVPCLAAWLAGSNVKCSAELNKNQIKWENLKYIRSSMSLY